MVHSLTVYISSYKSTSGNVWVPIAFLGGGGGGGGVLGPTIQLIQLLCHPGQTMV